MQDTILLDDRNLVAEFKLDGNALDSSGNGYNGTASNVVYTKTDRDYQSQCGVFNGSSSKVSSFSGDITVGTSFTVMALFKCTSLPGVGSTQSIFGDYKSPGFPLYGNGGFYLQLKNNSGTVNLRCALSDSGYESGGNLEGGSVTANKWYLGAMTYDGAFQRLYIADENGIFEIASQAQTRDFGTSTAANNRRRIGMLDYGLEIQWFNGFIQGAKVVQRALSEKEIRNHYLHSLRMAGGSSLHGLMDGLVASYDFKGDANDVIGGNDGTVNGATLTTDRFGNANSAYSFDGTNDYIAIPDSDLLDLGSNDFTVSVFAKFNNTSSPQNLFSKMNEYYNGGVVATGFNFGITPNFSDTQFSFSTWEGNSATSIGGMVNNFYGYAAGNYALFTVRRTGSTLDFLLNGTVIFSGSGTVRNVNTSFPINIGRYNWSYEHHMNGDVDYVMVNNKSLSDEQIKALYELTSKRDVLPFDVDGRKSLPRQLKEGCVLFVPGVVNGTTAYDASGSGNDGTLVNSPVPTRGALSGYKGLKFNGSNTGVTLGTKMLFSTAYSMGWNVNLASLPASGGFQFLSSRVGVSFQTGFYVAFYNNGGTMEFSVVHIDLSGAIDLRFAYPFVAGKNYRLFITWDGTNVRFYVNGRLAGTQGMTKPGTTITNEYWFGIYGNAMSLPLNGVIANPYVNTSAITSDKIKMDAINFFIPSP